MVVSAVGGFGLLLLLSMSWDRTVSGREGAARPASAEWASWLATRVQ